MNARLFLHGLKQGTASAQVLNSRLLDVATGRFLYHNRSRSDDAARAVEALTCRLNPNTTGYHRP